MITMTNCGVTISVWPSDVDFYKKAGYSVVVDEPAAAPVVLPPQDEDPAGDEVEPVKKTGKKN